MHGVMITTFIEKMKLKNATPELDTDKIVLSHPEVNRPALQLAGFFDHFDHERVQIVGTVERAYVSTLSRETKLEVYDKLLSSKIPCLVYCRGMEPDPDILPLANHYAVPVLVSDKTT